MNENLRSYIASLTPEEREKYKDLIEEALKRDRIQSQKIEKAMESARACSESMKSLMSQLFVLQESLSTLTAKLLVIRDLAEAASKVSSKGPVWN